MTKMTMKIFWRDEIQLEVKFCSKVRFDLPLVNSTSFLGEMVEPAPMLPVSHQNNNNRSVLERKPHFLCHFLCKVSGATLTGKNMTNL